MPRIAREKETTGKSKQEGPMESCPGALLSFQSPGRTDSVMDLVNRWGTSVLLIGQPRRQRLGTIRSMVL